MPYYKSMSSGFYYQIYGTPMIGRWPARVEYSVQEQVASDKAASLRQQADNANTALEYKRMGLYYPKSLGRFIVEKGVAALYEGVA